MGSNESVYETYFSLVLLTFNHIYDVEVNN